MDQFKDYLISSKLTDEKRAGFYINWITRFYKSCNKNPDDPVTQKEIDQRIGFKVSRVQGFK